MIIKKFILFFLLITSVVNSQDIYNLHLIKNYNVRPGQDSTELNSRYSAIWGWTSPQGREYAILCCVTGTSFIDITDTNNISECGFVEGEMTINREAKTYLNYAYITADRYHVSTGTGIQIVDLSFLPDSVHHIKNWTFENFSFAHTLFQENNFLYLNGANSMASGGITIIDISDPVNPVKRGQYTRGYIHDCYVRNDTIYGALTSQNKYVILDASNKDSIKEIVEFNEIVGYDLPHSCWLSDDGNTLITANESRSPPGNVSFWNISELKNINYITTYRPPGNTTSIAHNIFVKNKLVFVSHHTAGLRILDYRNPNNPMEIAYHDTYPMSNTAIIAGNWGCYPFFASGKIISSDMQTGLYVHKLINDPTSISNPNLIINAFNLLQNYPNPFNPKTVISYSLLRNSMTTVKVYDVLGKEVRTLVNEMKSAGSFEVDFDGSNLSSGIYFYSLYIDGRIVGTKSMVLMK